MPGSWRASAEAAASVAQFAAQFAAHQSMSACTSTSWLPAAGNHGNCAAPQLVRLPSSLSTSPRTR